MPTPTIDGWSPLAVKWLCMYHVNMVLPAVYDDELSYMELLAKIQNKVNEIIKGYNNLNQWQTAQDAVLDELAKKVDDFIDGGYKDDFAAFVDKWLKDNMERIMGDACKMVFFGLTKDGYFCAYVPRTWADIQFDTGAVYGRADYGRLILRMSVDGSGVIDNTYSYSLNAKPRDIEQLVADLEVTARRGDACYDALFTNMDVEVSNGNF